MLGLLGCWGREHELSTRDGFDYKKFGMLLASDIALLWRRDVTARLRR